jgi:hypothetical protein
MSHTPQIAAVALALLAAPQPQTDQAPADAQQFSADRLEQMVAPIALYPDTLLTQVLMASTYPLEVVEADRFMARNPGLTGPALDEALKTQSWDPSVKALCGVPTVLKKMSDDLDWTRDLGDAFLGQKTELMDTVQRMRNKAIDAGNLKSTTQQKVVQTGDTVVIEPAAPDVVYVPAYSPVVVYGPGWYYPYWYYPYWYPPPVYDGPFITFGIGFFWGGVFWGHCDWHQHTVFVDVVEYRTFAARTGSSPSGAYLHGAVGAQAQWVHDPSHRMGVAYRSPQVAKSFAGAMSSGRPFRDPGRRPEGLDRRAEPARPPASELWDRKDRPAPAPRERPPAPGRRSPGEGRGRERPRGEDSHPREFTQRPDSPRGGDWKDFPRGRKRSP